MLVPVHADDQGPGDSRGHDTCPGDDRVRPQLGSEPGYRLLVEGEFLRNRKTLMTALAEIAEVGAVALIVWKQLRRVEIRADRDRFRPWIVCYIM